MPPDLAMPVERHVQLFRRDLRECRLNALADLDLAGEHHDGAVRIDADPGIERVAQPLAQGGVGGDIHHVGPAMARERACQGTLQGAWQNPAGVCC
jgi:hypothetical protein